MERIGLPRTKIMQSNVSERRAGRNFMDVHNDVTLELTGRFFADEIDQFDYHLRSS